ncbi:hypothetical protein ES703_72008 [subsurface metagenome]
MVKVMVVYESSMAIHNLSPNQLPKVSESLASHMKTITQKG